jgi:hypothetical protein
MALLVAFVYLFYGLVTLESSGKSFVEIFISSFVVWIVGYSIGQLLTLQGILIGEKDDSVINTKKEHARVIENIGSDITYLEYFCAEQTAQALKTARASKLSSVGLKYQDFFTDDGYVKEENVDIPFSNDEVKEARNKKKREAIEEAIYMKVTPLTVESLTTDNGNKYDPYDYGKDKTAYIKSVAIKAAIQKVAIGVGFGYFAIKLIQDFAWGYLYWTGIQVGIFLLLGSIGLFKAYLFVTDTQRQNRIKKINKLEQFKGTDMARYKRMVEEQYAAKEAKEAEEEDQSEEEDQNEAEYETVQEDESNDLAAHVNETFQNSTS